MGPLSPGLTRLPGVRRLFAAIALSRIYVYVFLYVYTLMTVMRTNIDIDDDLIEAAMRATGQTTKRGTVEEALRRVVTSYRRQQAIADMDGAGWDGDLEAMRTGQAG